MPQAISGNLWSIHPPNPPTSEEAEVELQLREAEQRKKLADNVSWHSHI